MSSGAPCLDEHFFNRPADEVARSLLGKEIVRRHGRRTLRARITETEAYLGSHDRACHAARGRTKRTEVMFGPPGTLYVYFIYGMYWMLNVVTGEAGCPAAVLIRGVQGVGGPGRVTRAFAITGALNGRPAAKRTGLWFEDSGANPGPDEVVETPRIGIDYAGPVWVAKKLRFVLTA
jgi:DNA-3-methyladenine glycosylase